MMIPLIPLKKKTFADGFILGFGFNKLGVQNTPQMDLLSSSRLDLLSLKDWFLKLVEKYFLLRKLLNFGSGTSINSLGLGPEYGEILS